MTTDINDMKLPLESSRHTLYSEPPPRLDLPEEEHSIEETLHELLDEPTHKHPIETKGYQMRTNAQVQPKQKVPAAPKQVTDEPTPQELHGGGWTVHDNDTYHDTYHQPGTPFEQNQEHPNELSSKHSRGNSMRVSDLLMATANWLSSIDNEAILLAEDNEACLESVAKTCLAAAEILKAGAVEAERLEPVEPSKLTPEALDHLQLVMTAFDTSGDEDLQKTASVIDELLLSIASPPNWAKIYKETENDRLETLEKLYREPKKELDALYKTKESAEAIDKAPMFKTYRICEAPLSTRSCPDHPGAGLSRIPGSDTDWQCSLDKRIYNWKTGFSMENGSKVLPGDVAQQTPNVYPQPHSLFDSRETRLNGYMPSKK